MELLCLVTAVTVWMSVRRLTAGLPIAWRGIVAAVLVLLSLAVPAAGCFALLGTPSGYHGDSGLCPTGVAGRVVAATLSHCPAVRLSAFHERRTADGGRRA